MNAVGIGGVNRDMNGGKVAIAGVNRALNEGYATIGGVNRKIFSARPAGALYWEGDECTSLTGGWVVGFTEGNGSQSKEATYMQLYGIVVTPRAGSRTYVTNNPINLTDIKTLYAEVESPSGSGGTSSQLILQCSSSDKTGTSDVDAQIVTNSPPFAKQIRSVDVSNLTGNYYIKIRANTSGTNLNSQSRLFFIAKKGNGITAFGRHLKYGAFFNLFVLEFRKCSSFARGKEVNRWQVM